MPVKEFEGILMEMFKDKEEAKEHLNYLKLAYARHKRFAKLKESLLEKILSAFSMAILIFVGSALFSEAKKYIK